MTTVSVGIVGAGMMGSAASAQLRDAGYPVTVCDINPQVRSRERRAGSAAVTTPSELMASTRIVLLSLPLPRDVVAAVTGGDGVLPAAEAGTVVVDLSTVDPDTTRRNAAAAAQRGVGYLDAPVLGRPNACGRWTLPVGGREDTLQTVRPVLDVLAARVCHVGGPGSGNVVKLLNNLMFGAINAITAECMAAADALGLSRAAFHDVLASSNAASISNLFLEIAPKIVAEDWSPTFTIDLLTKDNDLAVDVLTSAGLSATVAEATAALNRRARDAGLGQLDTSAIYRIAAEERTAP